MMGMGREMEREMKGWNVASGSSPEIEIESVVIELNGLMMRD